MKKFCLAFLTALIMAGFFPLALHGQVLTLDQTDVKAADKTAGAGYITGAAFNAIKAVPPGSYILLTMRGTENLDWGSVGGVHLMETEKSLNSIPISPQRGGTYQVKIRAAELFEAQGAGTSNRIYVGAWGNHTIQKVEFVVPAFYTPPAQLSLYDVNGTGLGNVVTLKGATVVPGTGIVVPFDKNNGENGAFEFELELSTPINIERFEKFLINWDGVHTQVCDVSMFYYFHDDNARGRWTFMKASWLRKNNAGFKLGENVENERGSTAWRTLNKKAITKIRFGCYWFRANNDWEQAISPNDPAIRDLVIKSIRFVDPEPM